MLNLFYILSILFSANIRASDVSARTIHEVQQTCQNCRQEKAPFICSLCKKAFYCGASCQKSDWPQHKDICKEIRRTLGEKKLKSESYIEAIHFLQQLDQESLVDGKRSALIKEAYSKFDALLADSLTPKYLKFFFQFMNDHNFINEEYLLAVPAAQENLRAKILLDMFHQQMKWAPLAHGEMPSKLCSFIGIGTTIVTPIVQTLPILLSDKFETVYAVDLHLEQIIASLSLENAINGNRVEAYKSELLNTIQARARAQWDDDLEQQLRNEIDTQFNILPSHVKNNIKCFQEDLFAFVEDYQKQNNGCYPQVVFLSTIPYWDTKNWPPRYSIIRSWLEKNVTVIFTAFDTFFTPELYQNFIGCFDDIAEIQFAAFGETPESIHIRLRKK